MNHKRGQPDIVALRRSATARKVPTCGWPEVADLISTSIRKIPKITGLTSLRSGNPRENRSNRKSTRLGKRARGWKRVKGVPLEEKIPTLVDILASGFLAATR
ncbi:unnamed protein product [Nesidiocoris tenuis]|uniref:Uncharacterized protein n=1 Tax=Nesidiocoris tenuis TaxID=355587 RepID=A0A6H5FXI0_9HEMI|nr:unnamed protein product [Nesidiocoris tenuis]